MARYKNSLYDWCVENSRMEVLHQWDGEKNEPYSPQEIGPGTEIVVWWKCEKGHEYQMSVYGRTKAKSCPICSNRRVLKGFNDLETMHPDVALEWNYEKNKDLIPSQVTYGSSKKVWWKCKHGHEWEAVIVSRTRGNKAGCPVCAGNVVVEGYNDLMTTHPEIAKEWSPNNKKLASQVSKGSGYKAIWICEKNHEYSATVGSRVNLKSGCPICAKELQTSFPEKAICFYLKKSFADLVENYRVDWLGKSELDMYIPELNLAIEYDGGAWHKNPEKDLLKDKLCNDNGISLIRVRDDICCKLDKTTSIQIIVTKNDWNDLNRGILDVYKIINNNWKNIEVPPIDIERDKSEIYKLMDVLEKRDSLYDKYPELADQWDNEKNGFLTPKMVTDHVGKKVWWKCEKGHSWQATVASRVDMQIGCPYCSNRKVLAGDNDLATTHPHIAAEWHPNKNKGLTARDVVSGSNIKAWWICSEGHEYEAMVNSRISKKTGCPICSGKSVLKGYNDLETKYPDIAAQWHPTKNEGTSPTEVVSKSDKKVWWICDKGHEWQAQISNRVNGTGCPVCAGKVVVEGYNDLGTTHPEIVAQWNHIMNKPVKVTEVSAGSNKKVWWICSKGHVWDQTIAQQVSSKGSCPICSGKRVVEGQNDIFTLYPELKNVWDYEKNIGIIPENQGKGSKKMVWWKCDYCGEHYERVIQSQVRSKRCPVCKEYIK